jgi:hypothetical protein
VLFDAKVARLSRGLAASAVLCAIALTAARARAQDPQPTLLAYKAPADCPAVGDFQRSVQRRSARIHFVDEGSHDRQLSIFLRKDGDFTVGELRLIEASGTLRQRSVRFTTCAEAVEGLALIATVSLDPQALLEAPGPVPETPPTPPPRSPHSQAHEPMAATPPLQLTPGVETEIGAELNAYFNALPKTAFGGTVFMDVSSTSRHWLSPSIRGAISHVERLGLSDPAGQANFTLTLLSLSGCPLRIGGDIVVFRPCATLSGGALHTRGTDTNDAPATTRQYFSWGGSGMFSARLGELLEIVGDAGVGVTLIRDQFSFGVCPGDGCHQFWKTPELYLSTGLGFRLRLP